MLFPLCFLFLREFSLDPFPLLTDMLKSRGSPRLSQGHKPKSVLPHAGGSVPLVSFRSFVASCSFPYTGNQLASSKGERREGCRGSGDRRELEKICPLPSPVPVPLAQPSHADPGWRVPSRGAALLEHSVQGKAPVPRAEERADRGTGKVQHPIVTET